MASTARAALVAATTLVAAWSACSPASAGTLPVASGDLSVLAAGDATITDTATIWNTNSAAGDVNGDGIDDLALDDADTSIDTRHDAARIVYGSTSPGVTSAAAAAARGWTITVPDQNFVGREIEAYGIGDFDHDGFDDVGALFPSPYPYDPLPGNVLGTLFHGDATAGRVTQIGDATPRTTQLVTPNGSLDSYHRSIERLGDVNGDGYADLAVVWSGSTNFRVFATVIFGGATWPASINLEAPGSRGFLIRGFNDTTTLTEVRAAGDFNGDGKDDILVSNRTSASAALSMAVVFGSASTTAVDLSATSLGDRGVRISGVRKAFPWGDLNGDGFDDLLAISTSSSNANRSFVVKGRAGTAAFALGAGYQPISVEFVDARPAGDINGDGRPDIVGDLPPRAGLGAATKPHSALIFGPKGTAATDAITLSSSKASPTQGIRFFGDDAGNNYRTQMNAVGDFNGDGHDDLIARVGRPDPNSAPTDHHLYLGYGAGSAPTVDVTPPAITGWFVGSTASYGSCGFFGQTYTDPIGMSFTSDEAGTFDVTTTGTGGTKTGTVKFGLGPQNVFLPASLSVRAAHVRTVTVVPVDAAGNRGVPLTGTTTIKAGAWRWSC